MSGPDGGRVALGRAPKACRDVAHRTCPPEETVARVEPLVRRLGDVDVRRIEDRFSFGYPVYIMTMRTGRYMRTLGKGATEAQARASGLMEFAERYSAKVTHQRGLLVLAEEGELSYRAIAPAELAPPVRPSAADCLTPFDRLLWGLFSGLGGAALPERTNVSDALRGRAASASLRGERRAQAVDTLSRMWVRGWSLTRDEAVMVPACFSLIDWDIRDERGMTLLAGGSSGGLASGNTMEEAVFMGLTEAIERDAQFNDMRTLDLADLGGHTGVSAGAPRNRFLADIWGRPFMRDALVLSNRSSARVDVATFSALLFYQLQGRLDVVVSGGTHLDPEYALLRAATEFVQQAAVFRSHMAGVRAVQELPLLTGGCELVSPARGPPRSVRLEDLQDRSAPDVGEDVGLLLAELEREGREVLAVDLTHPDLGIPVVRVLVPGLLPQVKPRVVAGAGPA